MIRILMISLLAGGLLLMAIGAYLDRKGKR